MLTFLSNLHRNLFAIQELTNLVGCTESDSNCDNIDLRHDEGSKFNNLTKWKLLTASVIHFYPIVSGQ